MTKKEALADFKANILPSIIAHEQKGTGRVEKFPILNIIIGPILFEI